MAAVSNITIGVVAAGVILLLGIVFFLRNKPSKSSSKSKREVELALIKVDLFRSLGKTDLNLVKTATTSVEIPAGKKLFTQGDEGDSLYIIKKGKVQVFLEGKVSKDVAKVSAGSLLGEMSLLTGEKRTASARTIGKVSALKISCEAFYKLNAQSPNLRNMIWMTYTWRVFDNYVRNRNIPTKMSLKARQNWFAKHYNTDLKIGKTENVVKGAYCAFIITGAVHYQDREFVAPAFIEVFDKQKIKGIRTSRLIWLPPIHAA